MLETMSNEEESGDHVDVDEQEEESCAADYVESCSAFRPEQYELTIRSLEDQAS